MNDLLRIERANLFDLRPAQDVPGGLKVGLDLYYYKLARNGLDSVSSASRLSPFTFN